MNAREERRELLELRVREYLEVADRYEELDAERVRAERQRNALLPELKDARLGFLDVLEDNPEEPLIVDLADGTGLLVRTVPHDRGDVTVERIQLSTVRRAALDLTPPHETPPLDLELRGGRGPA